MYTNYSQVLNNLKIFKRDINLKHFQQIHK